MFEPAVSEATHTRRGRSTGPSGEGKQRAARRVRAWPFAAPAFIALALGLLYPLVYSLWISLHVDRLSPNDGLWVGLKNYISIFQSGELIGTLGRTFYFTVGSLVLQFIVGLAAALALEFFPRGSRIMRPLLLAPWVMPGVAVAAVWLSILNPISGLANTGLAVFGIPPVSWLSSPGLAMLCLILVNTWKSAPYWMLMISAGLQSIPKELIEAARVDGATYPRILWSVLLPGLRPVLATSSVLAFIWTFNYFDLAYLLTNGGPGEATTTLPFAIWETALKFNQFDVGAAYSVLSVIVTGVAIAFYFRATRKQRNS